MANIQNLRMGVCSLTFNGVDVGHTLGGVKVTITRKLTDLKADKYGDSPIDKVLTDVQLKVATKVAEPVVSLIKETMPEGSYNTGANGNQLGIAAGEGASMRATAAQLTLHPLNKAATDYSEDLVVYLAVPTANPVLNYDVANQRVFDLEFDALVSEAYTAGRRLAHIGVTNVS
jgi:hypothetical protein